VSSVTGPGPVAVVHRITIGTAFAGALAYVGWAAFQPSLLDMAAGLLAAVLIAAYWRNLRARLDQKLARRDADRA
jgi:hypothetical protein